MVVCKEQADDDRDAVVAERPKYRPDLPKVGLAVLRLRRGW